MHCITSLADGLLPHPVVPRNVEARAWGAACRDGTKIFGNRESQCNQHFLRSQCTPTMVPNTIGEQDVSILDNCCQLSIIGALLCVPPWVLVELEHTSWPSLSVPEEVLLPKRR